MSTPGLVVEEIDASPIGGTDTFVGRPYIVAEFARGPLGAIAVSDLDKLTEFYGEPTDYSFGHDAVEAELRDGASEMYVSRAVSPTATTSSASVAGGKLTVSASSPGDWGDDLLVGTTAVTGGFQVYAVSDTTDLEVLRSRTLLDALDAKAWSDEAPRLIKVVPGGTSGTIGTSTAVALTGGDDGRAGFTPAAWVAAVNRIPSELGPGLITVPGITDPVIHAGVADHCLDRNRFADLDLPRGSTISQQLDAAIALEVASEGARRCELFCQSGRAPARRGGKGSRLIPYSATQSGITSRYFATGRLGDPIANVEGRSRFLIGLDRTYTDAERGILNAGGISVARIRGGVVETYSDRVATPSAGPGDVDYAASASRTVMGVRGELAAALEDYVLRKVDGRGSLLANTNGALTGVLKSYYDQDALYGATNDDAYTVTVAYEPEIRELEGGAEFTPSPSTETVRLKVARRAPTT